MVVLYQILISFCSIKCCFLDCKTLSLGIIDIVRTVGNNGVSVELHKLPSNLLVFSSVLPHSKLGTHHPCVKKENRQNWYVTGSRILGE